MPPATKGFELYQRQTERENFAQFKGSNYSGQRSFFIAVRDASVLRKLSCNVESNPGFAADQSVIVRRPSGHPELWTSPHVSDYRAIHLAFFAAMKISVPSDIVSTSDSDHAYAASAAGPGVGLVRMSFISRGANRSFGAGFERRFTHRTLDDDDGACMGNLFDLYKSVGGRFLVPRSPAACGAAIVEDLIARGIAPAGDRASLMREAAAVIDYIQDQDTAYAVDTRQY